MKPLAINKRVRFDYDIIETLEAGIELLGTEVKSVKAGHMSLQGAFVNIHDNGLVLTNSTIPPWQIKNAPDDYDPTRSRRLLVKKSEVKSLIGSKQAQGLTIVPVRVYTMGSRIKVEIALVRGKKKHDKKQMKKERDIKRDAERLLTGKED